MIKSEIDENDMLVYGGGGNLIPSYNDARNFIKKYHEKVHALVVLPHTINGHADLLSRLGSNVHIFCREDVSYDYVYRQADHANVYRFDDIALQLNIKDLNVPLYDLFRISKNYRKGFYNLYHDALGALRQK